MVFFKPDCKQMRAVKFQFFNLCSKTGFRMWAFCTSAEYCSLIIRHLLFALGTAVCSHEETCQMLKRVLSDSHGFFMSFCTES